MDIRTDFPVRTVDEAIITARMAGDPVYFEIQDVESPYYGLKAIAMVCGPVLWFGTA
jgi:hypothetical protein